jgi:membrane fusion protein (multidrug efflux system)
VIPPENATGNFTKIVQRVPVRIALDGADAQLGDLRPGLSITVSVNTRSSTKGAE